MHYKTKKFNKPCLWLISSAYEFIELSCLQCSSSFSRWWSDVAQIISVSSTMNMSSCMVPVHTNHDCVFRVGQWHVAAFSVNFSKFNCKFEELLPFSTIDSLIMYVLPPKLVSFTELVSLTENLTLITVKEIKTAVTRLPLKMMR